MKRRYPLPGHTRRRLEAPWAKARRQRENEAWQAGLQDRMRNAYQAADSNQFDASSQASLQNSRAAEIAELRQRLQQLERAA